MRLVWLVLPLLGTASPVAAGERIVRGEADVAALLMADHRAIAGAQIDTLALLMADRRVTGGLLAPAPAPALAPLPIDYDIRAIAITLAGDAPAAVGLSRFEALAGAGAVFVAGTTAPDWRVDREEPGLAPDGPREVVGEGVVRRSAPFRRKTLLSGSVTLHLDGREASPSLMAGGAAAVLNVLPR